MQAMKKVDYSTVKFKSKHLTMIKRIKKKLYTERKHILLGMLNQYYFDFKESEIIYHIPFTREKEHIERYRYLAKSYKDKALVDITNAYMAVSSNDLKQAEGLLTNLIETEFYTSVMYEKLGKWQTPTRGKNIKISYEKVTA